MRLKDSRSCKSYMKFQTVAFSLSEQDFTMQYVDFALGRNIFLTT